jgi:metal-dependent amidase/aminoacylase/carboxypeptidase family protein
MASEDFGSFGSEWHVPSVFWFGGELILRLMRKRREGRISQIPTNHNPHFAPVIHPTIETGVETLVVTTLVWLGSI